MLRVLIIGAVLAPWMYGCAGGEVRCEDPARYAGSDSIPPMRVPDDLSPPDESESLRVPPGPQLDVPEANGDEQQDGQTPRSCLESPPEYFEPDAAGSQ